MIGPLSLWGQIQFWLILFQLRFINQYYEEDSYIKAISKSIENFWEKNGKPQKTIFSYHGIPKKYHVKGDSQNTKGAPNMIYLWDKIIILK